MLPRVPRPPIRSKRCCVTKVAAVFDRYNIVHEAELHQAGDRLCAYLARPSARAAAGV